MGFFSLGRDVQEKLPSLVVEAVHDRIDHILEETSGFLRLKVGGCAVQTPSRHRFHSAASNEISAAFQLEDYLDNLHDELRHYGLKDLPGLVRSIPFGFDHCLDFFFGCLFCDLDLQQWIENACVDLTPHVERLMPNEPDEVRRQLVAAGTCWLARLAVRRSSPLAAWPGLQHGGDCSSHACGSTGSAAPPLAPRDHLDSQRQVHPVRPPVQPAPQVKVAVLEILHDRIDHDTMRETLSEHASYAVEHLPEYTQVSRAPWQGCRARAAVPTLPITTSLARSARPAAGGRPAGSRGTAAWHRGTEPSRLQTLATPPAFRSACATTSRCTWPSCCPSCTSTPTWRLFTRSWRRWAAPAAGAGVGCVAADGWRGEVSQEGWGALPHVLLPATPASPTRGGRSRVRAGWPG
jgi:hypothetical protein